MTKEPFAFFLGFVQPISLLQRPYLLANNKSFLNDKEFMFSFTIPFPSFVKMKFLLVDKIAFHIHYCNNSKYFLLHSFYTKLDPFVINLFQMRGIKVSLSLSTFSQFNVLLADQIELKPAQTQLNLVIMLLIQSNLMIGNINSLKKY